MGGLRSIVQVSNMNAQRVSGSDGRSAETGIMIDGMVTKVYVNLAVELSPRMLGAWIFTSAQSI